jgi:hypothetical protein
VMAYDAEPDSRRGRRISHSNPKGDSDAPRTA